MRYNLTGRIDTASAPKVDAQIQEVISKATEPVTSLTFDCSALEYISSTGLRIVLKYKKLYPDLEVINVSNDVYSVFEMTGFTRIITVKKALRNINLSECQLLAKGGNGEVYKISDEEIVKLSLYADGEEKLIDEMNVAREAFVLGVPTVISFDTVQVNDGRKGIVMEAVNPDTLSAWLCEHPEDMEQYVKQYVDIFLTTNAIIAEPGQFRSEKQWFLDMARMPMQNSRPEWDTALIDIVNAIPDGTHLIHNDCHPRNVLVCGEGDNRQLILIDMGDMGVGHPVMEFIGFASMLLPPKYSLCDSEMAEYFTGMPEAMRHKFCRQVISRYFNTTDASLIDRIMTAASNVGTIKLACLNHQFQPPFVKENVKCTFFTHITEHKADIIKSIEYLRTLIDV